MRPILATFLVLLLASCASTPIDTNPNASASDLYQNAMHLLNHKDYNTAIKEFQTLEARYPYGIYSTQAQLDVAYAYYKQDDQESANEACDSFIKLHPNNPHVDYAYYLKGLANFNYHSDFMSRISHQDMALRDPKETRASFFAFRTLITRFPKSRYAPDARQRLVFLVNELSHYEISVGRYYLKRGAWVAAANRAKYVLVHYPESNQARNALLLEIAAYQKLGLTHLANDTEKVLHLNFPDSRPVAQASAGEHHKAWWKFW